MITDQLQQVLSAYGLNNAAVVPFGSGLINRTWKVYAAGKNYVLQRINDTVFKKPEDIAHNIRLVGNYLQQSHPLYCFVQPIVTLAGDDMVCFEQSWFRMFPFVEGSHTLNEVSNPGQAYEAAKQFARFTKKLSGFDAGKLKITIPRFHDLAYRYEQFVQAIKNGNKERSDESSGWINLLIEHSAIVDEYRSLLTNPGFKLRVMHHDAKISNVLFNKDDKAIAVIDLDTIMPGYFISDVGDMIRTYTSSVNEEETVFPEISFRKDFYEAIVQGYSDEMKDELTPVERKHFLYAGKFMIYMQSLRFLIDYLNDDKYYGASYEQHNLMRAVNQYTLLKELLRHE